MNLKASRNLNLMDLIIGEVPVLWKLIDEITNLEKSTFLPKPARYSESVMLPEKFSNFKFYAVMFSLN